MPPNDGAIAFTVATISSTSFVSRQIGKASTPPNSLKSIALPSITGIAASGPMSPSPSTAEPSETTATVLPRIVSAHARSTSCAIAMQTRPTPGVYAIERSSRVFTGAFSPVSILPPLWRRNVRSETETTSIPSRARRPETTSSPCSTSAQSTVTSRITRSCSTRTRSMAPSTAPARPMAEATSANAPGTWGMRTRIVRL